MSVPLRVVLDTNTLIASIGTSSPLRWIFDALRAGGFTLCLLTPILLEYEEVIARKTTPRIAENILWLLLLSPHIEHIEPQFRWRLIDADPDDNKFVDTALAARADALVTHDRHFDVLATHTFPEVTVWNVDRLRAALGHVDT